MTLIQRLNDEADEHESAMHFEVPPLRKLIKLLRESAVAIATAKTALIRIRDLEDSEDGEPLDDAIRIARATLTSAAFQEGEGK